mmetsp:Transcript_75824/g.210510  ORF Transcript_75824/g.210510 Transcript_75824/m.210510 type:complete len:240 (-) Transcript_75824:41-760(-)
MQPAELAWPAASPTSAMRNSTYKPHLACKRSGASGWPWCSSEMPPRGRCTFDTTQTPAYSGHCSSLECGLDSASWPDRRVPSPTAWPAPRSAPATATSFPAGTSKCSESSVETACGANPASCNNRQIGPRPTETAPFVLGANLAIWIDTQLRSTSTFVGNLAPSRNDSPTTMVSLWSAVRVMQTNALWLNASRIQSGAPLPLTAAAPAPWWTSTTRSSAGCASRRTGALVDAEGCASSP